MNAIQPKMKFLFRGLLITITVIWLGLLDNIVSAQDPAVVGIFSREDSSALWQLPEVVVVAKKESSAVQSLPVSVTAVQWQTISDADIRVVKDAAAYAPNVLMGNFGPRRLSNPYFRGIGAGPNNPGVTTNIDGVPQLSANSSSIELIDVEQIEFVRGAQGALFGRNSLGGVINIISRRPSQTWMIDAEGNYGNYNYGLGSFRLSGPIQPGTAILSLAGGYSRRDGYTINELTDGDVDNREAWFGKGQLWFAAWERFEARLIVGGERDRDGDYALGDLEALHKNPHRVSHDFIGSTNRDVVMPNLILAYYGDVVEVKSISGGVWWKVNEATDLDYSEIPLMINRNTEEQYQFTQEIRLSSKQNRPWNLADRLTMAWQTGVFLFQQDYERDYIIEMLPALTMQPFSASDRTTADITTTGMGIYGQGTLNAWERLNLTAGLRYDFENATAKFGLAPAFAPPVQQQADRNYNEVSPQLALDYRFMPSLTGYASAGRGYKAGGFNAGAPAGNESYGEEYSWNHEIGVKMMWLDKRVQINTSLFYILWADMQMYVPNPQAPGNYYIDNVGKAESKGLELEVRSRPRIHWDIFGSLGWVKTKFLSGSQAQGADIEGRRMPFTPEFTGGLGTQYAWFFTETLNLFARVQVTVCGQYDYDVSNTKGQDIYSLTDFRIGVRNRFWTVESWIRNAFDTKYIPVAFAYQLAPSGYLGENGAPMTFGIRAALHF
jgi:iron complex outermembrane receptor protein